MSLLKLRAQDSEDVQVISAVLQDSIVPVCDMIYQIEDKSFIIVAQRLRREDGHAVPERICSALTIKEVKAVHKHSIDLQYQERMLDLLAITYDRSVSQINLIFAGGARIRLDVGEWFVALEDFGEAWPALCNPCHDETVNLKA